MRRAFAIVVLYLVAGGLCAQDEVLVVANLGEKPESMQRHEVRSLFMGNLRSENLTPVALPPGHPVRVVFNTRIIGLTESRIQSYWAQMRFSGRSRPPVEVRDLSALVKFLEANPGSVGYLPPEHPMPATLRVVYRSDGVR